MATVYNHDLKGLLDRMVRFSEEMIKSNSSSGSELNEFDKARIRSYLDAMSSYLDWVQSQPQLDLPESSPKEYEVADAPPSADVESEIINDLGRLTAACYEECMHSQSARKHSGLQKFDEGRVRALIAKCHSYITDYVESQTPLDLPESSPTELVSGPGKKGV